MAEEENIPLIDYRDGDDAREGHDDDDDDDDDKSTGFDNAFTPSGRFPDDDGDVIEMTSTSKSRGAKGGKKQPEYSFINTNAESRFKIMKTRQDKAWAEIKKKYPEVDDRNSLLLLMNMVKLWLS